MISYDELKIYYAENKTQIEKDWFEFLSYKSISSEESYNNEVRSCANFLKSYLESKGFELQLWESSSHPILFAQSKNQNPDYPTVLYYNHYDVQPVDPLEEWESDPFTPTTIGTEVFARGAQDNKGQAFYVFWALSYIINKKPDLQLNIKMCIEGDEETGSMGLEKLIPEKKEELAADYLVITDVGIKGKDTPSITLGARGITTFTLKMSGSNIDLHSGAVGGLVFNPLHGMVELLAKIRCSKTGSILIPGFYDDVAELSPEDKEIFDFTFDEKEFEDTFQSKSSGGELKYLPAERYAIRPTLEINGIGGGYNGQGFKTVIPKEVTAKLSCRLVPDQDPKKISQQVKNFLLENVPGGLKLEVTCHEGVGKAVRTDPFSPIVKSYESALKEVYKKPVLKTIEGGSIPITAFLADATGADIVFTGLGLPDDGIHAPNEHFGLDRLEKGFYMTALAASQLVKIILPQS